MCSWQCRETKLKYLSQQWRQQYQISLPCREYNPVLQRRLPKNCLHLVLNRQMALSYHVTCLDKHSVMYLVLILPGKVHCGVYLADLKGGVFVVKGGGVGRQLSVGGKGAGVQRLNPPLPHTHCLVSFNPEDNIIESGEGVTSNFSNSVIKVLQCRKI